MNSNQKGIALLSFHLRQASHKFQQKGLAVVDVLVGASGWVSRAATDTLQDKFGVNNGELLIYGSRPRREVLGNRQTIQVKVWHDKVQVNNVRFFLPFGFLAVNKFSIHGEQKFRALNQHLIHNSTEFIRRNKPQYCVLFSSGITHSSLEIVERDVAYDVYRELKIVEENSIREQCEKSGTQLLICRLFSASGRLMRDHYHYALGNLIFQGLTAKKIEVKTPFQVLRKFVDMEQLVELSLKAVTNQDFLAIDSSGPLIELHSLASIIAHELNLPETEFQYSEGPIDAYFSDSNAMEELAKFYGVQLLSIQDQVKSTIEGLQQYVQNEVSK